MGYPNIRRRHPSRHQIQDRDPRSRAIYESPVYVRQLEVYRNRAIEQPLCIAVPEDSG